MEKISEFVDLVAERALLSIFLNNKDVYIEFSGIVRPEDFSTDTHKIVFNSYEKAFDTDPDNIDKFTIKNFADELGFKDYDELTGNGKFVESLFVQRVNIKNAPKLVGRIKDLSIKRKLRVGVGEMSEMVEESEDTGKSSIEIISDFEKRISSYVIDASNQNEIGLIGDGISDLLNERADNPIQFIGVPSGFPRFDKAIGGGFRRGAVQLVGARPKNFKSGFALNVAKNIAVNAITGKPVPVLYLDTELTREYQQFRIAASLSKTNINIIETGNWRSNALVIESIEKGLQKVAGAPFYHIYVGGMSIDRIISIARYWLTKHVGRREDGQFNDCLVIYDYIKLMNGQDIKSAEEWQVLGFHMTALHDFVTRAYIPCLCLCQLNRDGADCDEEKVVAGADRLLWFSSSFTILRNKTLEELEQDGLSAGNMRMVTLMARYGEAMEKGNYLCFKVNKACMYMEEFKYKKELEPTPAGAEEELNSPHD